MSVFKIIYKTLALALGIETEARMNRTTVTQPINAVGGINHMRRIRI